MNEQKSMGRFIITLLFGWFGVHKFIDGKIGMGFLYMCTMGLFCFGWIIDTIQAYPRKKAKKSTYYKEPIYYREPTYYAKPTYMNQGAVQKYNRPQNKPVFNVNVNTELGMFLQDEMLRIDSMSTDGFQFEHYCAQLLLKNGFSKADVTQGSGDFGVDIIAEKDNISYAIQCKCYSNPVSNKAVQEAYSGKEYYKCMVAAVITNNTFTKSAKETAKQTRVLLWDREKLQSMLTVAYNQSAKAKVQKYKVEY